MHSLVATNTNFNLHEEQVHLKGAAILPHHISTVAQNTDLLGVL